MQQHPVPQNVTSYQFRLIGDMTLKQFMELAGGIIVAILFYYSHFLSLFKWPLVIGSALLGVALAFLPFQERPLDVWIKNFFKSIYTPTQYLWKKEEKIPDILIESKVVVSKLPLKQPTAKDQTILQEYLQSLPKESTQLAIDQQQAKMLEKINHLFTTIGPSLVITPPSLTKEEISLQPSIRIKVRKLKPFSADLHQFRPTTILPKTVVSKKPQPITIQPLVKKLEPEIISRKPIIEAAPPLTPPLSLKAIPTPVAPPVVPLVVPKKTVAASFSSQLPMPSIPDVPNIIAGMVLTNDSKILPNALIEIKNQSGATVRALKTNKLGQFSISSPLENDKYILTVENDAYQFDIIELIAEGKIIPPIKIKAKNATRPVTNTNKS